MQTLFRHSNNNVCQAWPVNPHNPWSELPPHNPWSELPPHNPWSELPRASPSFMCLRSHRPAAHSLILRHHLRIMTLSSSSDCRLPSSALRTASSICCSPPATRQSLAFRPRHSSLDTLHVIHPRRLDVVACTPATCNALDNTHQPSALDTTRQNLRRSSFVVRRSSFVVRRSLFEFQNRTQARQRTAAAAVCLLVF